MLQRNDVESIDNAVEKKTYDRSQRGGGVVSKLVDYIYLKRIALILLNRYLVQGEMGRTHLEPAYDWARKCAVDEDGA